jgi:hypothetical protein
MEIWQSSAVLGGAAYGTGSRSAGSCRAERRSGQGKQKMALVIGNYINSRFAEGNDRINTEMASSTCAEEHFFMFEGSQV